ncbi:MAG: hypothetical protein DMF64_15660 [Acidobacteria bacterium]|nr:MAG: hypothetical protein DMF64_15660 [Acidobacteriota bacterium]
MDDRDVLMTQVQLLLQQLNWAEQMLQSLPLAEQFRKTVATSFANRFRHTRGELERMQTTLQISPSVASYWGALQRRNAECRALFDECLSFIGGVLVREHKLADGSSLDGGVCRIADALLHELMNETPELYPGFTLLAESNFFTETTGIVRLRFPEYSVWNLPVAVHELGHYAMPDLKDGMGGRPFQVKLQQLAAEPQRAAHLQEYLADLFAVYTLGPAYICACLLWRFNPKDETALNADGEQHPSHAKRLHFMMQTLELMSAANDYEYAGLLKILRELWQHSWQSADLAIELEPKALAALKVMQKEVYNILDEHLWSARFARWPQAKKLAEEIGTEQPAAQLLNDESRLADVVNAAWLWRVRQQGTDREQLRQVGARALDLCRLLAQQKH